MPPVFRNGKVLFKNGKPAFAPTPQDACNCCCDVSACDVFYPALDVYYTRDAVSSSWVVDPPSVAADLPFTRLEPNNGVSISSQWVRINCTFPVVLIFNISAQPVNSVAFYTLSLDNQYINLFTVPSPYVYPEYPGATLVWRWHPGGVAYSERAYHPPAAFAPLWEWVGVNGYEAAISIPILCGGSDQ